MTQIGQDEISIRRALPADVELLLSLIRELAEYERLSHQVVATEARLEECLFGERASAETLIAECGKEAAGFALFFHNFSTFLGRPGIYLEDLYVRPRFRSRGIGRRLLIRLGRLARERDCGRLEWAVLNWNEPAIRFYMNLGAVPLADWTVFRLSGKALHDLADQ